MQDRIKCFDSVFGKFLSTSEYISVNLTIAHFNGPRINHNRGFVNFGGEIPFQKISSEDGSNSR